MNFDTEDENGNSLGNTGLSGHLGLDIRDANADGRWEIGEGVDFALIASAFAEANLFGEIETVAAEFLPSVSATIRYSQLLGEIMLSTDGGFEIDVGSPSLILEDVTLDVGSLFDSFLLETLEGIYEIVEPIKPVIDILLMEFPLGGIAESADPIYRYRPHTVARPDGRYHDQGLIGYSEYHRVSGNRGGPG